MHYSENSLVLMVLQAIVVGATGGCADEPLAGATQHKRAAV
jgi:hypothetical protein